MEVPAHSYQVLMIDHKIQVSKVDHKTQVLMVDHKTQVLMVDHKTQVLMVDHKTQVLKDHQAYNLLPALAGSSCALGGCYNLDLVQPDLHALGTELDLENHRVVHCSLNGLCNHSFQNLYHPPHLVHNSAVGHSPFRLAVSGMSGSFLAVASCSGNHLVDGCSGNFLAVKGHPGSFLGSYGSCQFLMVCYNEQVVALE